MTVQGHAFGWQANAWVATQAKDALRKPFEHAYLGQDATVQEHLMQAFHQKGALHPLPGVKQSQAARAIHAKNEP